MFSLKDSCYSTFGMLDKAETCVAVTVYNLAQGKGVIIGDTVAIPEPYLSQVRFRYEDKVQVRGQGTNLNLTSPKSGSRTRYEPGRYLSQVRFKYKDKVRTGTVSSHWSTDWRLQVCQHCRQEYQMDCIRVESPLVLVVNGKKQGMDKLANIRLASIKKSN
uniref:Tetratricopeptide repeat protein 5 OB fold domain-containing protein n=1 Tax=Timema poppense TaxID=170557 RepID=A0A7R9HCI6_TIMPO|nr:unnamed protein product [Timema poppensis]